MTTDVKTCKLVGISKEAIEAALMCLKIIAKNLVKCANTMNEAKQLARNILMTKSLWLQTEYMGSIHSVLLNISKDHVGTFFVLYEQVGYVTCILSKAGVLSGDFTIQVTLDRKNLTSPTH